MTEEILSSDQIKTNFKSKIKDIKNRLIFLIDNLDMDKNVEVFGRINDNIISIEEDLVKLENTLEISNLSNLNFEERNRIIDQKILKLFTPFIFYYKMCLLQNNN